MIDALARPIAVERHEKARLAPVLCAMCGHPVSHTDPRVAGAVAGGMCMNDSCLKDKRTGVRRQVFTFNRLVTDQ